MGLVEKSDEEDAPLEDAGEGAEEVRHFVEPAVVNKSLFTQNLPVLGKVPMSKSFAS